MIENSYSPRLMISLSITGGNLSKGLINFEKQLINHRGKSMLPEVEQLMELSTWSPR